MADPTSEKGVELEPTTRRVSRPGRARRVAVVGLRVFAGVVGVVAAVAVVAAVGLVPLPSTRIAAPTVVITPAPSDQTRLCAGAVLRLGDDTGQNAGVPSALGAPAVETTDGSGTAIGTSDASTGGTAAAPLVLTLPDRGGQKIAGAQSQVADAQDYSGFAASACTEPSSSIWLVGGSTAVGRTTLLTLIDGSSVDATVALTILGPNGAVTAPGMAGIVVKAGQQRVISLAGFAPNLASPVVHVTASGGQVSAFLQQSIVRGLDAGGVDVVGPGADPALHLVIPGLRVLNAEGVRNALALPDWDDAVAAIRVAVPGVRTAKVQVRLVPQGAELTGVSFQMDVAGGQVSELPLDSGADVDTGAVSIPDGDYTVLLDSDQPIIGGARVSTVSAAAAGADGGATAAPASDFAWYASAPTLTGDTALAVAAGPSPELSATNPGTVAITLTLQPQGGTAQTVTVPAGGSVSVPVAAGTLLLLGGAKGLSVGISYAGDAMLAAYPLAPPSPVSAPITVHP